MLKNINSIFDCKSELDFLELSIETFNFQYQNNLVYKNWVDLLKVIPKQVISLSDIPFLPIDFFRDQVVISTPITEKTIKFTSSSTTSSFPSTHFVNDIIFYEKSFLTSFELFYGSVQNYCVLALLPNYLERSGSSLVYMCKRLIEESNHPLSGFFLNDVDDLILKIKKLNTSNQKVLLIGVSYALMDLCDKELELSEQFIVMETGGMKGSRKEMLKPELHKYLKKGFKINNIQSEYGMTELLSQAYSLQNGLFQNPPWMKFLIREIDDPLMIRNDNKTGGINVIDLANQNSCSFIATKDLGRLVKNNNIEFLELMGRYDHSDTRGCNLMIDNI